MLHRGFVVLGDKTGNSGIPVRPAEPDTRTVRGAPYSGCSWPKRGGRNASFRTMRRFSSMFAVLIIGLLAGGASQAATFLDLISVTPGGPGSGAFSGTLGEIFVTGSITGESSAFYFSAPGPGIGDSTIDGSSPQFSYSTVFSPTALLTDRVGYTYPEMATNLVTMTFSAPVTDPVFHVANLNGVGFSFAPTSGLTSLTLLNGNDAPDGDGIDPTFGGAPYGFVFVSDANPATSDFTPPSSPPPTAGGRAAYASVRLNGTFSTIAFAVDGMGPPFDGGSFTLSIVPEPDSLVLAGLGVLGVALFGRRRARRAAKAL